MISVLKTVVAARYWANEAWREAIYVSLWKNFARTNRLARKAAGTLLLAAKLHAHTEASLSIMSRYGALRFQSRLLLRRTPQFRLPPRQNTAGVSPLRAAPA